MRIGGRRGGGSEGRMKSISTHTVQVMLVELCLLHLQDLDHKVRLNILPHIHEQVHSSLQRKERAVVTRSIELAAYVLITSSF